MKNEKLRADIKRELNRPTSMKKLAELLNRCYVALGELDTSMLPAEAQAGLALQRNEIDRLKQQLRAEGDRIAELNAKLGEQHSAGVVMPERKDDQGAPTVNLHIFREGWNACLDEFARLNGKEVVMPEGYALVPQRMYLSEEAIESITVHCGDGQDDAGYGPYQGGVLWIGEIEEEDGTKTYGLHIATADYPEAGSTTLYEFARLNGKEVGRERRQRRTPRHPRRPSAPAAQGGE